MAAWRVFKILLPFMARQYELEAAFKEAVDDYLATCAKLGDKPNKPYSGKLTLRIPPSVHAAIATAAETRGKSLNKWVADTLDQSIQAL